MPRRKSKPSESSWAAAFGAALRTRERRPSGRGWRTASAIQAELRIGHVKFYQTVRLLKATGRIEHFNGLVLAENKLVRADWYRIK